MALHLAGKEAAFRRRIQKALVEFGRDGDVAVDSAGSALRFELHVEALIVQSKADCIYVGTLDGG